MDHDSFKVKEASILADYEAGILTSFGVAQSLLRAGANSRYAVDKANTLERKSPLTIEQRIFFQNVVEQLDDYYEKEIDSVNWGGPTIHPSNPINPQRAKVLADRIRELI